MDGISSVVSGVVEIAGPVIERYGPTLSVMASNFASSMVHSTMVVDMVSGSSSRRATIEEIQDEDEIIVDPKRNNPRVEDLPDNVAGLLTSLPKRKPILKKKPAPPAKKPSPPPKKVEELVVPEGVHINSSFYRDIERISAVDGAGGMSSGLKTFMGVIGKASKK